MKVLVCGGAGYIGSHAVYELLNRGHEVVIVDNLQTGHLKAVDERASFYQGDIRDQAFLDNVLEKESVDGVMHFAANSLVGVSMKEPLEYYNNNVYGTEVLLRAMVKANVDYIIFSSTAATYGEPKTVPIKETDPTVPTNPYGETKLAMEKMIDWASKAHGIKYTSLRYFNVAGAADDGHIGEDHNPETHLIPLILQVPLGKREHISVFGSDYPTKDGTCIRDYIHVMDLVDAHILALEKLMKENKNNIYNLGYGEGFSVLEMIKAAEAVCGKEIKTVMAERRAGDPARLVASNEKALNELGWKPKFNDVNKVIGDAWNFHQMNPSGLE